MKTYQKFGSWISVVALAWLAACDGTKESQREELSRTSPPVFSPVSGSFSGPISVAIESAADGATIYFTSDNSPATESSEVYSGPIEVTSSVTFHAIAVADGLLPSEQVAAAYVINGSVAGKVALPAFSKPQGDYPEAIAVTIQTATEGASILYSTDGTNPSVEYQKDALIQVSAQVTTLKALAKKAGLTDSDVAIATYTITIPPPPISFDAEMNFKPYNSVIPPAGMPWGGNVVEGAIAAAQLDGVQGPDILFVETHKQMLTSAVYEYTNLWVGFDVQQNGEISALSGAKLFPSSTNLYTAGTGVSVGEIDATAGKDVLVARIIDTENMTTDPFRLSSNRIVYQIGHNLSFYTSGCSIESPSRKCLRFASEDSNAIDLAIPNVGQRSSGLGVSVLDLDLDGKKDLIVGWVDDKVSSTCTTTEPAYSLRRCSDVAENEFKYAVVHDFSGPSPHTITSGVGITSGIGKVTAGADISVGNFGGDPAKPDIAFTWVDALPQGDIMYYQIGFDLSVNGVINRMSPKLQVGSMVGWSTQGAGVAILETALGGPGALFMAIDDRYDVNGAPIVDEFRWIKGLKP